MGGCGVNLYKPGKYKYIHEDELNQAQKRIEQLEAELKNKDAVRLWNENEKLKEANRILRDGLNIVKEGLENCDWECRRCDKDPVMTKTDIYKFTVEALEQADKIMEGGEG
jgi:hypothetical protein